MGKKERGRVIQARIREGQLEQRVLPAMWLDPEVIVGKLRGNAAARGTMQESDLDQKRLVDFLDGVGVFGDGGGQGFDTDWTTLMALDDGKQKFAVHFVETVAVDFEHLQRGVRAGLVDGAVAADLSVVAHATQQAIRDARSAARTASDFGGAIAVNRDAKNFGRALNNDAQIFGGVELQVQEDAEARTKR